ncbi:hypothetical protein [Marinitoga sp. 1138]|uniref:hypothetical protein n=1 Tax=Marinitoga sp. 1138 TaxID=1643334 RepID=UPI0015863FE7|nr:hypothetical protein [Marinitoga sp. 1138]NUU96752.1 hypothetical protein [Marinitoga sp. 1138]
MKRVTIPFSDERLIESLEREYGSTYRVAKRATESWLFLKRRTLDEIKGFFEKDEIIFLVSMLNGTFFEPGMIRKEVMIAEIEDTVRYEQPSYNPKDLIEKINKLTYAQLFFLVEDIYHFWYDLSERNLEEFVEKYL